ncbi:MAG: outer membrane protein transport protein [Sphingobacteriales bacterium]|nr:outer membrane protein transport protein [Sphingobacteriales bacterium]
MRIRVAIVLLLLLNIKSMQAQNHYWAQQYGAEATLLGGAMTAGSGDNSAMYYNPARLGFMETPKISVSANVYGIDVVKLENAAGTDLDLKSTKLMLYPQIAAGSLIIKKQPKFKMVYGSLVRYRSSLHVEQNKTMAYDVFLTLPGNEFYDARVEYDFNCTSNWLGGAFAYRINDNWSIGYSQFFTYINLQYRQNYNIISANKSGNTYFVSSNNTNLNFSINNVGAVEKVGIAYENQSSRNENLFYRFGLTATMPSFKIFSKSKVYQSLELNNITELEFLPTDSLTSLSTVINNSNNNVPTQFKDPASIALGFEVENKKIKISSTVEYFVRIKEYNMIKDNSQTLVLPVQNNNPIYVDNYMTVKHSNENIVNVAVGFEYKFKPKVKSEDKPRLWSLLAGFRTDFNNHDVVYRLQKLQKGTSDAFNPNSWKYMHYSLGASIDRKSDKFSFGIDYGNGLTKRTLQAVNITEPTAANLLLGERQNTVIPKINSINFVMGYTYKFNKTDRLMKIKPL